MEATTNESVSQETSPILQLKRTLLPIDEYAAQQGLSKRTVEQHIQSGIIQVRKYKGKTYVVDVPLSPHHSTPEELALVEEDPEMAAEAIEQPVTAADASRPSFLDARKRTKRTRKTVAAASATCLVAIIMATFWLYINQTMHGDRLDKAFATIQTVHNNSMQTSQRLTALQTNLVESTAELQGVRNELNKTTAEVKTLQNELQRISQSLERVANEPPGSTPEVTEFRNLLNKTRAEVQTLRSQLALASEGLETTKRENAEALGLLRGQVQQLTALLNELAKNTETPPEPDNSDE